MTGFHASALLFSLLAAAAVGLGRGRLDELARPALLLILFFPLLATLPGIDVIPVAAGSTHRSDAPATLPALGAVWLCGGLLLIGRLALESRALRRLIRGSRKLKTLPDRPEIRSCEGLAGPLATGVFRPVILVPESWSDWPARARELALIHERAHLERRDPAWNLVATLACALCWFNPLVWWLARRQRLAQELACDRAVLEAGGEPREYAALLCDLATGASDFAPASAMARRNTLETRVSRILGNRRGPGTPPLPVSVALLLAALLLGLLGPREPSVPRSDARLRIAADPFPENP